MLYNEIISRTFTSGILKGITVTLVIPRVTNPRDVGNVFKGKGLPKDTAYTDTLLAVEECAK